jgi:hypothetical protein
MNDRKVYERALGFMVFVGVLSLGCITDVPDANVAVSGQVRGEPFTGLGGVAEGADGRYFLTLVDSADFDCFNTPTTNYLTVSLGQIDGTGSYPAPGNVSFATSSGSQSDVEEATSGTVTVESVDEFGSLITGRIDAAGETSSISGTFELPICN